MEMELISLRRHYISSLFSLNKVDGTFLDIQVKQFTSKMIFKGRGMQTYVLKLSAVHQ